MKRANVLLVFVFTAGFSFFVSLVSLALPFGFFPNASGLVLTIVLCALVITSRLMYHLSGTLFEKHTRVPITVSEAVFRYFVEGHGPVFAGLAFVVGHTIGIAGDKTGIVFSYVWKTTPLSLYIGVHAFFTSWLIASTRRKYDSGVLDEPWNIIGPHITIGLLILYFADFPANLHIGVSYMFDVNAPASSFVITCVGAVLGVIFAWFTAICEGASTALKLARVD